MSYAINILEEELKERETELEDFLDDNTEVFHKKDMMDKKINAIKQALHILTHQERR
jgi:hypothetical protein